MCGTYKMDIKKTYFFVIIWSTDTYTFYEHKIKAQNRFKYPEKKGEIQNA